MTRLLGAALLLTFALPAQGLYIQPEIEDLPLERLVRNLTTRSGESPDDPHLLHHLARTHAMAYARKLGEDDQVKTWKGWQGKDPPQPWFSYEPPHVPFHKTVPAADAESEKEAKGHLATAIEYYEKALKLSPDNHVIRLGLAWCQDQAGAREKAVEGYRAVLEEAWKTENKRGGGLGNFVYVETAGYLLPLLDAEKDAAEIAGIEQRKKVLLALPRAVTPIVVPLTRGATGPRQLIDRDARVRFDLDATGRQLEWPWITKDAAWLVHDPTRSGRITSAIQMFGSHSFLLFCADGYEALSLLDDDRDGSVSGVELGSLALWQDRNSDGVSDPGEVRPVREFGIVALSTQGSRHPSGIPYSPSGVTFSDGSVRPTYDLILESREAAPPVRPGGP